jgi:hypothetical protein
MRYALMVFAVAACAAQDVNEIVRRSLERDLRNQRALDDYTYEVKTINRTYAGDSVKKTETEVEEVLQIDGSRYRRKVEENGKPLTAAEAKREQEKMNREMARRRAESPGQRQKRIQDEAKQRDDMRKMRQDIGAAFDFRLLGEASIQGAKCWKVAADPKRDAVRLRSDMGKRLLPKMRGTLWISQASYEWLRVEAEVLDTIRFGWMLASLSKGSSFQMEQAQVAAGLWHPLRFAARIKARGLVIPFNAGTEVEFRNFRKFATESRMLAGGEEAPPPAPVAGKSGVK